MKYKKEKMRKKEDELWFDRLWGQSVTSFFFLICLYTFFNFLGMNHGEMYSLKGIDGTSYLSFLWYRQPIESNDKLNDITYVC